MPQRTSARKTKKQRGARSFIGKALIAVILFPFLFVGFYLIFPNVSALKVKNPEKTAFMRYREREWMREGVVREIDRTPVPISEISPNVIKAVITSEDDKFWSHDGFDIEALEDAARKNIQRKKFAFGASTITQQLAKNLYLTPTKSIIRKAKEAIITWRIERTLSKRRIIELYLNAAEWGDGIFGIEAAAQHYYHKPASALSASQAAHLAAVLPNPRKWSPTGGSRIVERRARRILSIMGRRGEIQRAYDDIMREQPKQEEPVAAPDSVKSAAPDADGQPSTLAPEATPTPKEATPESGTPAPAEAPVPAQ